jgi:formylmethanofuran dehydrogenase subunit C
MRRGTLVVGGDCGQDAGSNMLAGTVVVFGNVGEHIGFNMQRGSIIVNQLTQHLPCGFRATGRGDPTWIALLLRHLTGLGITTPENWQDQLWVRATGDHVQLGKGEIYIHDFIE